MSTSVKQRLAGISAAALLATTPLLVQAPAEAATTPPCKASMSDSTPKKYSNVYVKVKTAPSAAVKTVAHYKTTNTTKKGKANSNGRASIKYYISGATAGYKVWVDVYVTKNGKSNHCRTAFTPHA